MTGFERHRTGIDIAVVKAGRRGERWSEVRVNLPNWRSWRMAYSPVLHRFAGGRNLEAARRNPDFSDNEFAIVQAIETALEAAIDPMHNASVAVKGNNDARQEAIGDAARAFLLKHPGTPYTMRALASALAETSSLKEGRIRTHYLPELAKRSPFWNAEGGYWENRKREAQR